MRAIALLLASLLFVPSATLRAEGAPGFWEIYRPGPDGLPEIPIVGQHFAFDAKRDKFFPVFKRTYNQVYIVYLKDPFGYAWVTGNDPRRILPGSKVQGHRIGYEEENALDWFEFGRPERPGTWVQVRDRGVPRVYRRDPAVTGRIITETAPPQWTTWGGTVDPPSGSEVACTVSATPSEVRVGETVRFNVETKGDATSLTMFGQELLLPRDFVEKSFDRAGVYDVTASVGRGTTRNGCRTTVRVVGTFAGGDDFGCTLTLEPQRVTWGQSSLVTIRTFGDVTHLEYLDVPTRIPSSGTLYRTVVSSEVGSYRIHAKVVARGEEKRCEAPFTVTENASGR